MFQTINSSLTKKPPISHAHSPIAVCLPVSAQLWLGKALIQLSWAFEPGHISSMLMKEHFKSVLRSPPSHLVVCDKLMEGF